MLSRRACFRLPLIAAAALVAAPRPAATADLAIPAEYAGLPVGLQALHFPATGHNLAGRFLRYWWEHGQTPIFGYPITEELTEEALTVQYFERARFEYHSERVGTTGEVQLSRLGHELTHGRTEPAFEPVGLVAESPERAYFEATRHTLTFAFKRFWEANAGLPTFGYPLSEEFTEDDRTVQYFERARFEYVPAAAGTPAEVDLGHLGRLVTRARDITITGVPPRAGATIWAEELPRQIAEHRRSERQQAALTAVSQPVEPFQAVVVAPQAELRRAPTVIADRLGFVYARHIVRVVAVASGEPIGGSDRWYQLTVDDAFVPAAYLQPFTPPPPPQTWPGRWIDVNLTDFYATGYEDEQPLHSALVTAGRENRTPTGVFAIHTRVDPETMDSTTVGIPKGHPEYYLLKDVRYTQYFAHEGLALHGNYWVHPSRFGRFSSNGCIGMLNPHAAWFWDFATFGTPVHVHF